MTIKHAFASLKADSTDNTVVRPSNWNADHVIGDGTMAINAAAGVGTFTLSPGLQALTLAGPGEPTVWAVNGSGKIDFGAVNFPGLILKNTDPGTGGPFLVTYHNSPAATAGDLIAGWTAYANDTALSKIKYGQFTWSILNSSPGTQASSFSLDIFKTGNEFTIFTASGNPNSAVFEITPPGNTMSVGLSINQTALGPTTNFDTASGNTRGFNYISVNDQSNVNVTSSLYSQLVVSGTNWVDGVNLTQKNGAQFVCTILGTPSGTGNAQPIGIQSVCQNYVQVPNGQLFAANFRVIANAFTDQIIGNEYDIINNATVNSILGINCGLTGAGGSLGTDLCYACASDAVAGHGWDFGFTWFTGGIKNSGTVIGSPHVLSCGKGIDFSNATFINDAIHVGPGQIATSLSPSGTKASLSGQTQSGITVANGSNDVICPVGQGMLVSVVTGNTNSAGLWYIGLATATLVTSTGAEWVASTSVPGAGKSSIAFDGSAYKVYNNQGASNVYKSICIRTI